MILDSLRLHEPIPDSWPFYLPPVRHIGRHGLHFDKPITFIVGENGSGKSTLVEGIAEAYGLDVRGGHGGRKYAPSGPPKSPLGTYLKLDLPTTGTTTRFRQAP